MKISRKFWKLIGVYTFIIYQFIIIHSFIIIYNNSCCGGIGPRIVLNGTGGGVTDTGRAGFRKKTLVASSTIPGTPVVPVLLWPDTIPIVQELLLLLLLVRKKMSSYRDHEAGTVESIQAQGIWHSLVTLVNCVLYGCKSWDTCCWTDIATTACVSCG